MELSKSLLVTSNTQKQQIRQNTKESNLSSFLFCVSGYMAPEYAMHGRFSVKTDVYSFGVLVLEIITGKKNTGLELGQGTDLPTFVSDKKHTTTDYQKKKHQRVNG